jgi:2-amino-4-hydroxy-6-hydroxymethyldihydropteridine diphosphokinase
MAIAYIGLGSNLEHPAQHILQAMHELDNLPHCHLLAVSNTYRSIAVGPGEQPDYVNAVVQIETSLPPLDLLDAIQSIELAHGRVRDIRWGPRTLDLDMIMLDNLTMDTERLILPHPRAAERDFVLRPLLDIAPYLSFPDERSAAECLASADNNGLRVMQTSDDIWQQLRG